MSLLLVHKQKHLYFPKHLILKFKSFIITIHSEYIRYMTVYIYISSSLISVNAEDSKLTRTGVSFTIDFKDGKPTRMPSRLADRLNGAVTPAEDNNKV